MRLPASVIAVLGLSTLLSACGQGKLASIPVMPEDRLGPSADYPVVLGQPFEVDGVTYKPEDRLNFDQVGFAEADSGDGISIAHRTLPLPSYAEVTSLETGRTILVRVIRRGPMTGGSLVGLSPAAAVQLGSHGDRVAIRIRRVNPPEAERAVLRAGGEAPLRMDTPVSLVNVLRRKLDPALAPLPVPGAPGNPAQAAAPTAQESAPGADKAVISPTARPEASRLKSPVVPGTTPAKPATVVLTGNPASGSQTKSNTAQPKKPETSRTNSAGYAVQVGAFSSRTASEALARKLGGAISPAGKLYRVRLGPFSSRGEAEVALAKAKGAGYSDARIQRAD